MLHPIEKPGLIERCPEVRSEGPAEPMPGLINPGFNCEPFSKTRRVDTGPMSRPSAN